MGYWYTTSDLASKKAVFAFGKTYVINNLNSFEKGVASQKLFVTRSLAKMVGLLVIEKATISLPA